MANFNLFFDELLKNEGGFVHHPSDPGGATNLGIILANWQRYGYDKDLDGDIDVYDLKLINKNDAYFFFKKNFWDVIKADLIKNQNVANILFDMHVNAPSIAVRILQKVLKAHNPDRKSVV